MSVQVAGSSASRSRGISAKFEHILTTRCQYHLGPLAIIGLSAKFGVAVFKSSNLDSLGGSIGQSRFVCQVWCSSIQVIYS